MCSAEVELADRTDVRRTVGALQDDTLSGRSVKKALLVIQFVSQGSEADVTEFISSYKDVWFRSNIYPQVSTNPYYPGECYAITPALRYTCTYKGHGAAIFTSFLGYATHSNTMGCRKDNMDIWPKR